MSYADVCSGTKLPIYSCPYQNCSFRCEDRCLFLHHVAGGRSDSTHREMLDGVLKVDLPWMNRLDYVYGAVAVAERERWPRIGLSTTRRALNVLCQRYNDESTQCLACFVCAQLRVTCRGYAAINLDRPVQTKKRYNSEIELRGRAAFRALETQCPGTLLNNCSYNLWHQRYVVRQQTRGRVNPLLQKQPKQGGLSSVADHEQERHISEWALQLPMSSTARVTLFGCTEDVQCSDADSHKDDFEKPPFVRRLCQHCQVPVCFDCWMKLHSFRDGGSIPMSVANDHYYGYVDRFLVENKVTWLECAAASVCWSTMLVYQRRLGVSRAGLDSAGSS